VLEQQEQQEEIQEQQVPSSTEDGVQMIGVSDDDEEEEVKNRNWPSNSVDTTALDDQFKRQRRRAVILYDYEAIHDTGHTVIKNEIVWVSESQLNDETSSEWIKVYKDADGEPGYVPRNYISVIDGNGGDGSDDNSSNDVDTLYNNNDDDDDSEMEMQDDEKIEEKQEATKVVEEMQNAAMFCGVETKTPTSLWSVKRRNSMLTRQKLRNRSSSLLSMQSFPSFDSTTSNNISTNSNNSTLKPAPRTRSVTNDSETKEINHLTNILSKESRNAFKMRSRMSSTDSKSMTTKTDTHKQNKSVMEESLFNKFLKIEEEEKKSQNLITRKSESMTLLTRFDQTKGTLPHSASLPSSPLSSLSSLSSYSSTSSTTTTTTTSPLSSSSTTATYDISLGHRVKVSPIAWNSVFKKKQLKHGNDSTGKSFFLLHPKK
jgi:hypothetical protein